MAWYINVHDISPQLSIMWYITLIAGTAMQHMMYHCPYMAWYITPHMHGMIYHSPCLSIIYHLCMAWYIIAHDVSLCMHEYLISSPLVKAMKNTTWLIGICLLLIYYISSITWGRIPAPLASICHSYLIIARTLPIREMGGKDLQLQSRPKKWHRW